MGIDKLKKGAAYDSLIDASKIIQQEGGDLRGAIKSGSLQSQIINAISKNLDKSTDLKKQIDAAILKGEITKDIASADTTDKRLKEARIKQLERQEKQNTTAAKIAASFRLGPDSAILKSIKKYETNNTQIHNIKINKAIRMIQKNFRTWRFKTFAFNNLLIAFCVPFSLI